MLAAAVVMLALTAEGCGGSSGPLQGVTTGMTAKAVRAKAGRPLHVVRSNPRNPDCWVWASNEHRAVCFKQGRVDYIGP
jgi:hypothetical protein